MRTLSKFRGLVVNIGLSIASLLILFAVFELGFRAVEAMGNNEQNANESWAIYDQDLGYRPRPNYADYNSDGLRDDPIDPVKTKFRILMLGDSVAYYGDSIEDTYVGQLESKLNADSELVPTEVINAGVRGYTNYQELIYLKKYGLEFKPDLVGVGFVMNDLHKYLHQFRVENGEIVGEYFFVDEAVQSVDSPVYRLARKSHFLVWLRQKLGIFESLIEIYSQNGYTFEYRPDFNTAWQEESWATVEVQLKEMVRLGEIHGFRVFIIIFPFGEQMREDYLTKDYNYVITPQRQLMDICESLKIVCLDLFSVLDRDEHLEADDIHLTKPGKTVVAEKVTEFLKKHHLIPTQTTADEVMVPN